MAKPQQERNKGGFSQYARGHLLVSRISLNEKKETSRSPLSLTLNKMQCVNLFFNQARNRINLTMHAVFFFQAERPTDSVGGRGTNIFGILGAITLFLKFDTSNNT